MRRLTLSDSVKPESEVQYTCDNNYISTPSTADRTYTCVNGGDFTYTAFRCLKSKWFQLKLIVEKNKHLLS